MIYKRDPLPAWQGVASLEALASPIAFLARALEGDPGRLAVFLEWSSAQERSTLLELCAVLRRSPATKSVPLGCLLPERHREVLAGLQQAAVCWVSFPAANQPLLSTLLSAPGFACEPWLRVEEVLREICPHLNYLPVEGGREMCVCGAYRNRMVLGRKTLHDLCQESEHRNCPYFLDPHHPAAAARRETD
ncbi:MAG: hypothetical protein AB1814_08355 [Thermodesulfobacteriota bacterium]